ncbi:hypothetical protein [Thiohalocapsa sp. ML1]|jgi:hypothetical protein|uniref:hypothetical protein n=1 Tax=Thiohalocapsa sp. ML1 TaxID=1431688 RepID=UPI000731F9D7|nr:hypothetical protein [Thiohalocapsa sp. ML1]
MTKAQALALKAIRRDRLRDGPDNGETTTVGDTEVWKFYDDFSEIHISPSEIRVTGPWGEPEFEKSAAMEFLMVDYMIDSDALDVICNDAWGSDFDPQMQKGETYERPDDRFDPGEATPTWTFSDGSMIKIGNGRAEIS